ncbi:B-cell lymphoma 3-encoded protein [Colletotrichum nymphaeae SA-01]|uniref:B-cell lymphoma 3-encoded protein n=1 Tax=Colletotrichum nymphaeae SA-01 TaxID=1460502 RepID=A0A135STE1_9PEZI|nr:B-cell lymphoma 3-encoded protein [Colletotrichum nymphaeae SA-01]
MDPLSITTSILTILQLTSKGSGLALGALKSLREAPETFKQLITDAEVLRCLLLDTEVCLRSRHGGGHEDPIPPSIIHVLKAIKERVAEFELLVHTRLSRRQTENGNVVTKVKRARMLQSEADIQRIKMNIRDSCDILRTQLHLLQLDDKKSLSKHNITCYFPPWLVSRAIMASVNLENVFDAGAKVSLNVPLVVPEEDHIVWPLVMAGNLGQLRELLSRDRNLMYVRNQWGQSIMHVAAKIHQPAVFNFLKNEGMDENLADENQKSAAITVLTRRGSQEYNLPVDTDDLADRLGWTNLHKVAALGARHDQEITEALLRESEYSDINTKDILGRTPLHWLAENGKSDAIRLITQDPWSADVQARDLCGFTALHCACWADDFDSIVALLDVGIDINALDKHMRTPMMHMSSPEILKYLLRKGADVHISDDEGANVMHHACVSDQEDLVEILLREYGHSLLTRNHTGDTPLGQAIANNSLEVLKIMAPYLQGFPELQYPVPNESLVQPEKLSLLNNNKRSLLHLTALHGSTEAMDILAPANLCCVDTAIRDKDGHTPNECFVRCRDNYCAVTRKPFESEKLAWVSLMNSARGQEMPFQGLTGQDADDESTIVASEDEWGHRKRSTASYVFIDPSGGEVSSDDEFVDAEDEVRE